MNESRKSRTQTGQKCVEVYDVEWHGQECQMQQSCQGPQGLKSCHCQWNPVCRWSASVVRFQWSEIFSWKKEANESASGLKSAGENCSARVDE